MEAKPSKLTSILIGGLAVGVLLTSYLAFSIVLCCLPAIAGGMVAVWHYTSENELTIQGGEGAVMGIGALAVGFLLSFALNFVLELVGFPSLESIITGMMYNFFEGEALEAFEAQLAEQEEAGIGPIIIQAIINFVIMSIFAAIGGAIGAAAFKRGPEPDPIESL